MRKKKGKTKSEKCLNKSSNLYKCIVVVSGGDTLCRRSIPFAIKNY